MAEPFTERAEVLTPNDVVSLGHSYLLAQEHLRAQLDGPAEPLNLKLFTLKTAVGDVVVNEGRFIGDASISGFQRFDPMKSEWAVLAMQGVDEMPYHRGLLVVDIYRLAGYNQTVIFGGETFEDRAVSYRSAKLEPEMLLPGDPLVDAVAQAIDLRQEFSSLVS